MSSLPPPFPTAFSPAPFRWRATAIVAWLMILGVCIVLPLIRGGAKAEQAIGATQPAEPGAVNFQTELAGRLWVGIVRSSDANRQGTDEFVGLQADTPVEKVSRAIVLADLGEKDRALELLRQADDPAAPALIALYAALPSSMPATAPATQSLSTDFDRRYGWYARLAHVYGLPDSSPQRAQVLNDAQQTLLVTLGAVAIAVIAGAIGLALFITAIVLIATGRVRNAVHPTGPAANAYVEATAIYLAGFIVSSLAIGFVLPRASLVVHMIGLGVVVTLATVWPLMRGVPWSTLRQDWGIHAGRGWVREILNGIGGYLAGLPVLAVGLLIMIVLIMLTKATPSHPIQEQASDHSAAAVLSMYLLASVFAPLTEELMFRGALVAHIRGWAGVVIAALLSGLIFAAVHPQGWTVVPALASVGTVLALIRQWRGTLISSITAHALHNGFLITVMTLATR